MQQEYKDSMEQISLSNDDKQRILANVLAAYEKNPEPVEEPETKKKPLFSIQRVGSAAAAVVLLCIGGALIYGQIIRTNPTGQGTDPAEGGITLPAEVAWTELDSVDDISKETECRTYTLGNVSKKYKVKKVQVAKEQKHVKITYQSKKKNDKILFEYKEEENAEDITSQFDEETELATEKVGDSDVKMYGVEKCDGITWQKESCTFGVRMTKACTTESAKKIVSGTKDASKVKSGDKDGDGSSKDAKPQATMNPNAVGWKGTETESTHKEKKDVLKQIYNRLGFRVTITSPATKVAYKKVDDFESFAFYYNEDSGLQEHRIIGYAGWEGCPSGVMDNYWESSSTTIEGSSVKIYQMDNGEKLFTFMKQDISFTILIDGWKGEDTDSVLGEIFSVITISLDSGDSEPAATKEPVDEDEPDATDGDKALASSYRETALKIQDAVVDKSMKKLSAYISYPITIKDVGTIASAKEFQTLSADTVFTSDWVDAVVSYDTGKIKKSTQTFTMGDSSKSIVCRIKNNSVVITELHLDKVKSDVLPTATPLTE